MDVLHLCHQFLPETRGGVESYVADVAAAQRAAGRDAQVLCGSHVPWPAVGVEALAVDGLPVHRLHRDDLFFDLYAKCWHPGVEAVLVEFLQRHRPAVVHVHQWIRLTSDLVAIAQRLGIPAVVTLHDHYAGCPRAFRLRPDGAACLRPLCADSCRDCVPRYGHESAAELDAGIELFAAESRAELLAADAVLVGTRTTADLLASALGLPPERFAVLGLGYRRRFPGLPPLPGPRPGEPLRFAFWGGVAPHKGTSVLLEALRRLHAAPPARAVELHVLGGFATEAYERELRSAGQGLPVTFHGRFATEALRQLAPAVGVFPSTCLETFGIVLDECVELGLPSIVSDRGALAERVGGGGLVVPAGDAAALAAAMRRFAEEPELWPGLRARLPALPGDLVQHGEQLASVYAAAAAHRLAAGSQAPTDLLRRRAALLRLQRESALARLPHDGLR